MEKLEISTIMVDESGIGVRLLMPPKEAAFLSESLSRTESYLEYGSGGSTILALRLGVRNIISVESDRILISAIQEKAYAISSSSNLKIFTADIGVTGPWGYPINSDSSNTWPGYAMDVWETLPDDVFPQFMLIDGRFRVSSFMAALLHAHPGSKIMYDDLQPRWDAYGAIRAVIDPIRMIGRAGIFEVPSNLDKDVIRHIQRKFSYDPR